MKLREKINKIRKELNENGSNDKLYILNKMLTEEGLLILPRNVNRKTLDQGNEIVGNINRNSFSYELSCEFLISDNEDEVVFPSVISSHVSHSDLLKEAYETMLYIVFGTKIK